MLEERTGHRAVQKTCVRSKSSHRRPVAENSMRLKYAQSWVIVAAVVGILSCRPSSAAGTSHLSTPAPAQTQTPPQTPPGMMPYVAILDPQFVPASEATFLRDDDTLIGVAHGNVAKAFPAADLDQHGSVNDQMPDGPIEVTWCGTCNTGAVFRAKFKGRLLHFDYDSMVGGNEVHKDRETGSRWQTSTWKEWRRRYPNTVVLKPLPGYDERMSNFSKRINAVTRSGEGAAPPDAFG